MAIDYASLKAMAIRLIGANGRDLSFQPSEPNTVDVNHPWRVGATLPAALPGKGVIIPDEHKDVPGGLENRRKATCYAYITGSDMIPEKLKTVIDSIGNECWRIAAYQLIQPGTVQVLVILKLEI